MANGSILLRQEYLDISKLPYDRCNDAVEAFCDMKHHAESFHDIFYYLDKDSLFLLYVELYSQNNGHPNLSQNAYQLLQNAFGNTPIPVKDEAEFNQKQLPRSHGGIELPNGPNGIDYLFNCQTWESWRKEWLTRHQDEIDWLDDNPIFPRPDLIIAILKEELLHHHWAEKPDTETIISWDAPTIVHFFYDKIIYGIDEKERSAYSILIGTKICEANYYRRESELEHLECSQGNDKVSVLYSLKRHNQYTFLSFDTFHAMFEVCDDNGNHVAEYNFIGNNNHKQKPDHSLLMVSKWKHQHHQ